MTPGTGPVWPASGVAWAIEVQAGWPDWGWKDWGWKDCGWKDGDCGVGRASANSGIGWVSSLPGS